MTPAVAFKHTIGRFLLGLAILVIFSVMMALAYDPFAEAPPHPTISGAAGSAFGYLIGWWVTREELF